MIVMDYSQVIISNLMAEIGGRTDVELDVNLLRHMVINAIRANKLKFGKRSEEHTSELQSLRHPRMPSSA